MRLRPDHSIRFGNDRFEGYCVDLLAALAGMLGFNYQIYVVPDGQFGDRNADGSWNGLVEEILNGVIKSWWKNCVVVWWLMVFHVAF